MFEGSGSGWTSTAGGERDVHVGERAGETSIKGGKDEISKVQSAASESDSVLRATMALTSPDEERAPCSLRSFCARLRIARC